MRPRARSPGMAGNSEIHTKPASTGRGLKSSPKSTSDRAVASVKSKSNGADDVVDGTIAARQLRPVSAEVEERPIVWCRVADQPALADSS